MEKKVYLLPKELDEEVARLHLEQLGAKLTKLIAEAGGVHRRQAGGAVQGGDVSVLELFASGWQTTGSMPASGGRPINRAARSTVGIEPTSSRHSTIALLSWRSSG